MEPQNKPEALSTPTGIPTWQSPPLFPSSMATMTPSSTWPSNLPEPRGISSLAGKVTSTSSRRKQGDWLEGCSPCSSHPQTGTKRSGGGVSGADGPVKSKGWDVPIAGRVSQPAALNSIMAMMASLFRVQKMSKGQVKVVTTHRQLTSAMDRGVLAAVMHMEGVEAIKKDLDALGVLYEAGLRSLGPVWSRPNAFGSGVPFNFPDSPDIGSGLTPAGQRPGSPL